MFWGFGFWIMMNNEELFKRNHKSTNHWTHFPKQCYRFDSTRTGQRFFPRGVWNFLFNWNRNYTENEAKNSSEWMLTVGLAFFHQFIHLWVVHCPIYAHITAPMDTFMKPALFTALFFHRLKEIPFTKWLGKGLRTVEYSIKKNLRWSYFNYLCQPQANATNSNMVFYYI